MTRPSNRSKRIKRIRPSPLYAGAPYAYASVAPDGLILTAGACPLDARGKTVAPGNLRAQTTRALRNLFVALKAAGATRAQVLRTTIYVASSSRADLVAAWKVVRASFAGHDPPSTLLGVCTLGYPDQLVEIEATAVSARLPK